MLAVLLKNDPFSDNGMTNGKITLISSSDTFVRLTGEENYALIMVQTASGVTDENVQAIIALVTVLNIVNSISMSVSARMKQYGAMRAVGMGKRQSASAICRLQKQSTSCNLKWKNNKRKRS